jgi:translation initiation factor IF-1
MKINWNDIVTVKLTEHGWDVWRTHYQSQNISLPKHVKAREHGDIVTMELWEVAHIFGDSLYNGCQMPFTSTYMNIVKT